ncbi:MAG: hypothetical protein IPM29_31200 [Planctomycetes bacterium]|nr:hypothetical protein [Planctomycetota bacterium]
MRRLCPGWRTAGLLALSAALLSLGGCFRLRTVVQLAADGSGRQQLDLAMSAATFERLQLVAQALDGARGGPGDPTRMFDADAIRAELAAAGLRAGEHRCQTQGAERSLAIDATFERFDALRGSPLLGPGAEWFVLAGRNPGNLRIVLYPRGHAAWQQVRERVDELARQPDDLRHQYFDGQRRRLAGLDVELELELPGDVDYASSGVETIAPRTVRWAVRATDLGSAEDVVRALAPRIEVEFDGRTCAGWPLDAEDPGPRPRPSGGER